jgi:hypothetical protein
MLRSGLALGEAAGAFHDDVDTEFAPRELLRVRFGEHGDVLPVGLEAAVGDGNIGREPAVHAVELEQQRIHVGRAEIVDRHEIQVLAAGLQEGPEGEPANSTKSVDGDARVSHVLLTS